LAEFRQISRAQMQPTGRVRIAIWEAILRAIGLLVLVRVMTFHTASGTTGHLSARAQ
jgi:hypothetical protein